MSIWQAKNEPFELIVGNLMIAVGGFLVGYKPNSNDLIFLLYLSPIFIMFGVFFDVRVLRKFSYELNLVKLDIEKSKNDLKAANTNLEQTKMEVQQEQLNLTRTKRELQDIEREVRGTKRELEQAEKNMKATEEKIFGSGGSRFSRSSWAEPIERNVSELKRKVEQLERQLERITRGW